MAGTFRDFMLGLADAAPKLAELMGNYAMFSQQQQNVERQIGMEEKRTEASVKASEAQTEYYNISAEELKTFMPIKKQYEELKLQNEQFITDSNKALQGSKEEYKKLTGKSFDLDQMLNQNKLLQVQIAEAYNKMGNENARTKLAEMSFDLQKVEFGMNVFNSFGEAVVTPEGMAKLNKHWENSKGDLQLFTDYVRTDKDLEMLNPRLVKSFLPVLGALLDQHTKFNTIRAENAVNINLLHTQNKKNAWKAYGVDNENEYQLRYQQDIQGSQFDIREIMGLLGVQVKEQSGYTSALGSDSPPISGMGMRTMYDSVLDIDPTSKLGRIGSTISGATEFLGREANPNVKYPFKVK